MSDNIVKDSSLWKNPQHHKLLNNDSYSIRVGMVKDHFFYEKEEETRYVVEVWKNNRLYPMNCTRANTRFGGLFNYEEFTYQGFEPGKNNITLGNFQFVPGDMVIVAAADGNSREGFIISALNHFGRKERLPANSETAYISEFNGLRKTVGYNGAYTVTFNGKAENIDKLREPANGKELPFPEYKAEIAGSYYQFNKDGSFTISDATDDVQSIFVDKPNGKIVITSGKTSLVIDKKEESYTINNKKTTFNSTDEWNLNTKATNIKSTEVINAEAADIKTKGNITQEGNVEIKGNTKQSGNVEIDGQLSTTGPTSLAGGAHKLIYKIVLIKGDGNLGGPVISRARVKKTTKTKAS